MKGIIRYSKSCHNTLDVYLYNITDIKILNWFELMDIWGSKGRHNDDGGIYFELPLEAKDILLHLPFAARYNLIISDSYWE